MSGRPWTDAERSFMREHYRKMLVQDIAIALSRTRKSLCLQAMLMGLTRPAPRFSESDKRCVRELAEKGWCNSCIGRDVRHNKGLVRKWRQKLGLPAITRRRGR